MIRITHIHEYTYTFEYYKEIVENEKAFFVTDTSKPVWSRYNHEDVKILKMVIK